MLVISPLSNCSSLEARDIFMQYIQDIAQVTIDTEPDTLAYAWFCSAGDNDEVPHHFVRGFELYKTAEANQVVHRASDEYKRFRSAVQARNLLLKPSDLRLYKPAGIGFLSRGPELMEGDETAGYVVVDEIRPAHGEKARLLQGLASIASAVAPSDHVRSYWVLEHLEKDQDDTVMIFQRYISKDVYKSLQDLAHLRPELDLLTQVSAWRRVTTWIECGIGFIGR